MSTEDKIAEIRREIEKRAFRVEPRTSVSEAALFSSRAAAGVVIYGVPLSDSEIESLTSAIAASLDTWLGDDLQALWEMLERGKR